MSSTYLLHLLIFLISIIYLSSVRAENEHVHDTSSHCDDGNSTSTLSTDHKDLFPMNGYDISSTFLVFIGSSFANAGGAGGGGIFVPLLILLTQFTPHGAIPLSIAMSTFSLSLSLGQCPSFETLLNTALQINTHTHTLTHTQFSAVHSHS